MFDWPNKNGSIDVKTDEAVLDEKSSFKMLGLTFSSKLDWGSYISTAKTACKKIGALITEILCSFKLVLERKTGREIPESTRLEFLEKFSANNFVLSDAEDNTAGH